MNRRVAPITPDTSLREAARRMSAQNTPCLPVCNGRKLVGLITPRDLIVRATAQGCDPRTSPVREVMTRPVVCGRDDQDVDDAAELMHRHHLSQMPVVNRQHQFVGIISLTNLETNFVGKN